MSDQRETSASPDPVDFAAKLARLQAAIGVVAGMTEAAPEQQVDDEAALIRSRAGRLVDALGTVGANLERLQSIPDSVKDENDEETSVPLTNEQHQLIVNHVDLVDRVAQQFKQRTPKHVQLDDLVSFGYDGLMDAARRFDASKGYVFSTYARHRIHGAILDGIRAADWVGRSTRRNYRALEQAQQHLAVRLGREPTDRELASEMELSTAQVRNIRQKDRRSVLVSLDAPTHEDSLESEKLTLADSLVANKSTDPQEYYDLSNMTSLVSSILATLSPRKRYIISSYYMGEQTLSEIAEEFGVTESRISQIRSETERDIKRVLDCYMQGDSDTLDQLLGRLERDRIGNQRNS